MSEATLATPAPWASTTRKTSGSEQPRTQRPADWRHGKSPVGTAASVLPSDAWNAELTGRSAGDLCGRHGHNSPA